MKTTEEILTRSEELKASALVFKKVRIPWHPFPFCFLVALLVDGLTY